MMDTEKEKELEFEILGYQVRFKSDVDKRVDPKRVVDYVQSQAQDIIKSVHTKDKGQIAALVALKLASERLELEVDYKENIQELRSTAVDALNMIDEISTNPL